MTERILDRLCPGWRTGQPKARAACGQLAGLTGLMCNLLLSAVKIGAGLWFGSLAAAADGVNNLTDASGSVVSLVGFRLAARRPDAEHPFGHARYEYLATLAVSTIVMAVGLSLSGEAVRRILRPAPVEVGPLMLAALVLSVLVKLWMYGFYRKIGRAIGSDTLLAAAADSRNDVLATGAVLAAALLVRKTGLAVLDGVMGLAVGVFIVVSGAKLTGQALSPLVGRAPDGETVERIRRRVLARPEVLGMHDLMVHDYGPGHRFASLHVELPAGMDPMESHALIDALETEFLKQDGLQMTIHMDPLAAEDPDTCRVRQALEQGLSARWPQVSFHDLRVLRRGEAAEVSLDLVFPAGFDGDRQAAREQTAALVGQTLPGCRVKIKTEQSYLA